MHTTGMRLATAGVAMALVLLSSGVFAAGAGDTTASGPPTIAVMTNSGAAAHHRPASNDLTAYQALEQASGIRVDWKIIETSNYAEVLRARLAAGVDLPDVIVLTGVGDVFEYAQDGLVIALNDLIDSDAPNLKRWLEQPEHALHKAAMTSPDGNIYAVPGFVLPNTLSKNLMHNSVWLDAVGRQTPETTDDFVALLKAFRDRDPNGNGRRDEIPLVPTGKSDINIIGNAFGLRLSMSFPFQADARGRVSWDYVNPRYKEYLQYMNMLYEEQLLDQEFLTANSSLTLEKVGNDRVGTVSFWSTWAFIFSRAHPQGTPDGETPIFNIPPPLRGPHGDQYFERRIPPGGSGFVITRDSRQPETAMQWIDFARNSQEAIDIQNWGVLGETYEIVDGQKRFIAREDGADMNEVLLSIGAGQPPYPHLQIKQAWINRFPNWMFPIDEQLQQYYIEPFPPMAKTAAEIDTLNEINTDIETFRDEMRDKFITGQESIDGKWDEYVRTLEGMGSARLIQVHQQMYDRFVAMQ